MERRVRLWVRVALYIASLFIFVVGAIFRLDQMFLMALALALLPLAAWALGRVLSGGVTCRRQLPSLCGAGEAVPVTLTLTNVSRLPRLALCVSDQLPRRLRPLGERAPILLDLQPGESRDVTYLLEPERRGRYTVGPARVETTDLFGFYAFVRRAGQPSELSVYPAVLPLRRVFWEEAAASGREQPETSRRRGDGMEFYGVREYKPGDELRHVHWRTTARTGELSVAEYAQSSSRDTIVALDLSRLAYADTGDGAESALEYGVTLAASVCAFLLRRGHAVRLLTPLDCDDPGGPSSRPTQLPRILETLVGVEADADLSLRETLSRASALYRDGATVVCITPFPERIALRGRGGQDVAVRGLALEGRSFHALKPSPVALPHGWRSVRQGDDLIRVLEG